MQTQAEPINTRLNELRAWAVHAYTSLGLVLGFMALLATVEGRVRDIAILLTLAAIIDGTDGPLARWSGVTLWTPQFDGRKLDDITDYLNYVLIPVFIIYRFGLVTAPWTPVLFFVLLAAAYGFCHQGAKTDDKYFTGFPNYWNVIAFYMYLLNLPMAANAIILAAFALMVFIPVKYVSTQTKPFRLLTLGLTVIWTAMILNILATLDRPNLPMLYASLVMPAYYVGISFYLTYFWPRRALRAR
jgi:phosphatidylcholine synthase